MNNINFSNGYIEKLAALQDMDFSENPSNPNASAFTKNIAASEKAVRFANRWLNENIDFAEAIAAATAITSKCRWAAVSRLQQGSSKVNILALIDNGVFVDCFSYDFNQTPCEEILGQEKFCHFREVQHAFPEDDDLTKMGVADYAGCAFKDSHGNIAGHIFVMHDQLMDNILEIESVITTMVSMIQLEWPDQ